MNSENYSLQNQAYRQIFDKILKNEYVPGQKISQKAIEEDLGIGRTPVREALLRLRREELIYSVPQSGTFVTKINFESAINARFIRENLERKVVVEAASLPENLLLDQARDALAIQKQCMNAEDYLKFFDADEDFHKTFYLITNHAQVWDWLQTINVQLNRFRSLRLKMIDLEWNSVIQQHQDILNAVENHQPKLAEQATSRHLHMMLAEKQPVMKAFPNYFESLDDSSSDSFL